MPPRPATRGGVSRAAGHTLIELLFALGLLLVLAAMTLPQVLAGVDRSRTHAAARYLAGRMALARAQAVARAATVALRFSADGPAVVIAEYVDGNRNGVRSSDIASGVDRMLAPPASLAAIFPGVAIAPAPGGGGAVQVGASGIVSFTPAGTATSGTISIKGRQGSQFAVRVLGATGRTRVLRYEVQRGEFVETY
jgi:type II secretory pathway pseudopilin PulG